MDDGIRNAGTNGCAPAGRADQLGDARDAERVGKPQHILDAMQAFARRDAAGEDVADEASAQPRRHRRDAPATRKDREIGRPVARLGRYREVVAAKQTPCEREALRRRRARRHRDDAVKIGIAGEDDVGAGEHQRLDPGVGPGAAQAAHERRRQQNVAEPAQRDHEDARLRRQVEAAHGGDTGASPGGEREPRSTRPPRMPTPNT